LWIGFVWFRTGTSSGKQGNEVSGSKTEGEFD